MSLFFRSMCLISVVSLCFCLGQPLFVTQASLLLGECMEIQLLAFLIAYRNFLLIQVKGVEQELDAEDEDAALTGQME